MATRAREAEIFRQEQDKSALARIVEWMFCYRPGIRKYDRYEKKRFNPLSGRME